MVFVVYDGNDHTYIVCGQFVLRSLIMIQKTYLEHFKNTIIDCLVWP